MQSVFVGPDGRYEVNVKADKRIARAVNQKGAFRGEIISAEKIGKAGMIWSRCGTQSIPMTR